MSTRYRLKNGVPPDSELWIRASWYREYQPDYATSESYADTPATESDIALARPTSLVGAVAYDATQVAEGWLGYDEFLDGENSGFRWEVVDKDGTVWSETYEIVDDTTEG